MLARLRRVDRLIELDPDRVVQFDEPLTVPRRDAEKTWPGSFERPDNIFGERLTAQALGPGRNAKRVSR